MEQSPLPAKPPMRLASTTCQAMCMSGAMIGMKVTPRATQRTQQDLRQVRTACFAAAAGGTTAPAAARRSVPTSTTVPTLAASTSASVSRGIRSSLYPLLISWNQLLFYFYHFIFTSLSLLLQCATGQWLFIAASVSKFKPSESMNGVGCISTVRIHIASATRTPTAITSWSPFTRVRCPLVPWSSRKMASPVFRVRAVPSPAVTVMQPDIMKNHCR
jgi:hypothetical protein